MRRSEMLIIIRCAVDDCLDIPNESYIGIRNYDEYILEHLEAAGMLPPFTGEFEQQNITDRWGLETGETGIVRVMKNKWEPENEE